METNETKATVRKTAAKEEPAKAKLNLYQKILLVSSEVRNVEKNMVVGAGTKSSYKAVADKDVILAVKSAEEKFGVLSLPIRLEIVDSQIVETSSMYNGQEQKKSQYIDVLKMTVRILDVDNPSDYIEVEAFGRGIDPGDKGFGKASTYARKYCLLNAYKIATGEDPDKDLSEEGHTTVVSKGKTGASQAAQTQRRPTPPSDPYAAISAATTKAELDAIWNGNPGLQGDGRFVTALNDKANSLR